MWKIHKMWESFWGVFIFFSAFLLKQIPESPRKGNLFFADVGRCWCPAQPSYPGRDSRALPIANPSEVI